MTSRQRQLILNDEDWSELEDIISQSMKPVHPREGFVDDLRKNLNNAGFGNLPGIKKTRGFLFLMLFLVSILAVIAVIVRIVVGLVSELRGSYQ